MTKRERERRAVILTGCSWFFGIAALLLIPMGNDDMMSSPAKVEIEQAEHPEKVFGEIAAPEYAGPGDKSFVFEGVCGEKIGVNLLGTVNSEKRPIADRNAVTKEIKEIGYRLGADVVRITRVNPTWVFKGADLTHACAIVVGEQLPYSYTLPTPFPAQTAKMVTDFYRSGGQIALLLADAIRKMGYPARAHYESWSQVLTIPVAVDAGIGELGRNGLLITPEFGPRGRFSVVTTDLPLEPDAQKHTGVQEFCAVCTKCVRNCPANAVPLGSPSVVRGISKWEVDLKKCMQYWYTDPDNYLYCLGCITSCPFNKPGNTLHKIGNYCVQRNQVARYLLSYLDDILGYGYRYEIQKSVQ